MEAIFTKITFFLLNSCQTELPALLGLEWATLLATLIKIQHFTSFHSHFRCSLFLWTYYNNMVKMTMLQ